MGDVTDLIAGVADEGRRKDCKALMAMMAKATGAKPKLWPGSIVGYGQYHYRYDSGREGDAPVIGLAPRKGETVLYLTCDLEAHAGLLKRLGKTKAGKGCLYIKRLEDVDTGALEELMRACVEARAAERVDR